MFKLLDDFSIHNRFPDPISVLMSCVHPKQASCLIATQVVQMSKYAISTEVFILRNYRQSDKLLIDLRKFVVQFGINVDAIFSDVCDINVREENRMTCKH